MRGRLFCNGQKLRSESKYILEESAQERGTNKEDNEMHEIMWKSGATYLHFAISAEFVQNQL